MEAEEGRKEGRKEEGRTSEQGETMRKEKEGLSPFSPRRTDGCWTV